ncbi:MAG: PIG-L family deacetylase [Cyclobacteriaceae bacterium]|nr:PIG-L family deacetylase [Cyclobacteriaceae bacterium]
MNEQLKLMAILAHPDDETLGFGGIFARYSSEGAGTFLVTATRGEKGRFGREKVSPGLEMVGKTREKELHEAAKVLGIREVHFLDYIDGDVDQAPPAEIVMRIAGYIRRIRPHVVLSFDPAGAYGHPDHIAISQFAMASVVKAADPEFETSVNEAPHAVSKFYYLAWPEKKWNIYQSSFKELASQVDGIKRTVKPWPDWNITTRIDAKPFWRTVWDAVLCHQTQMAIFEKLADLVESDHQALWGSQELYRVFSTVNGGRNTETDLFEGLR